MLCRFATLSNLVQSCSAMLRVVHSILKTVKNVQWTRLNFFCLKKMFSRFATPLNIVQFAQARYKCKKGEFRHDGEEMESSASISSMNSRERYSSQGRTLKFCLGGGGCQHALDRLNFSGPTERIWAVRTHWEL